MNEKDKAIKYTIAVVEKERDAWRDGCEKFADVVKTKDKELTALRSKLAAVEEDLHQKCRDFVIACGADPDGDVGPLQSAQNLIATLATVEAERDEDHRLLLAARNINAKTDAEHVAALKKALGDVDRIAQLEVRLADAVGLLSECRDLCIHIGANDLQRCINAFLSAQGESKLATDADRERRPWITANGCLKCGYTQEDQRKHGDHHLCDGEIPKGDA